MATQIQTAEQAQAQLPALTPEGEMFALRQRQARMFASSPLVPEHLRKGTPEQAIANCWIALTLAEAMGEVPLIVMQNIHVVSGKAGFASQYMIARANNSGIFKGRIDWRIDRSDPSNLSVTAFATIKDSGQQVEVTCDMKMAKAENWTKNSKYQTMPEVMLRYRSAAFLVRFYAPDVMLGYQTVEEVEDVSLAAAPATEPLTAKMLIDQSQPAEETPHDAETGEVVEDRPPTEQEQREHNGGFTLAEEMRGDDQATADETDELGIAKHPAEGRADELLGLFKAAETVIDLQRIHKDAELDIAAMPDEIAAAVENAFESELKRLKKAA